MYVQLGTYLSSSSPQRLADARRSYEELPAGLDRASRAAWRMLAQTTRDTRPVVYALRILTVVEVAAVGALLVAGVLDVGYFAAPVERPELLRLFALSLCSGLCLAITTGLLGWRLARELREAQRALREARFIQDSRLSY